MEYECAEQMLWQTLVVMENECAGEQKLWQTWVVIE
jgi:hypothetical protein